uniref:Uncharacterized protein n=1 Tax=Clandestinovirus TaxID=2831644 RepID=A0A8F8KLK8_9VIRU|nr:hypothetical protein KOM_12_361 [Clandestinovirus]
MSVTKKQATKKPKTIKRKVSAKKTPKRKVASKKSTRKSAAAKKGSSLTAYMKKMTSQKCPNGHYRKAVLRKLCVNPKKLESVKKLLRGRGVRGPMVVLTTGRGNKCINYVATGCK